MRKFRLFVLVIVVLVLAGGCRKNDPANDLPQLTIGTKYLGNFTPDASISYKRPEGYIVQLSSDTITFTILLTELNAGNYSITNSSLSAGKALFNIDFEQSSYSASSGAVTITDTSKNSLSGIYSVSSASKGSGDLLSISKGKFTGVQIGSFV